MTSRRVFLTTESGDQGERRFDASVTYDALKFKIEVITGIPSDMQQITIFDVDGVVLGNLDGETPLWDLSDGIRMHVKDVSGRSDLFSDLDSVPKYDMPHEEYAKRNESLLAFKRKNKLGRFAENPPKDPINNDEDDQRKAAKGMSVGNRCQVSAEGMLKRGTIRYIGDVSFKDGVWVGIEYDEPVGRNDGSVDGVFYFTSRPKHGAFVRPLRVQVGDFPEENLESDDEI